MAPSEGPIYICYAMPVSEPQLGARLLAYAEAKGHITTFRLVAKFSEMTAVRKLPEEVLSMIADSYSRFCLLGGLVRLYHGYDDMLGQQILFVSHLDLEEFNRHHGIYFASMSRHLHDLYSALYQNIKHSLFHFCFLKGLIWIVEVPLYSYI